MIHALLVYASIGLALTLLDLCLDRWHPPTVTNAALATCAMAIAWPIFTVTAIKKAIAAGAK
jgi:hypothetical protein